MSNNPSIRLQNAVTICQIHIDPRKKMAWGFLSMKHQNSFAMQLTPNYFLGKLILERMFTHIKGYNWHSQMKKREWKLVMNSTVF